MHRVSGVGRSPSKEHAVSRLFAVFGGKAEIDNWHQIYAHFRCRCLHRREVLVPRYAPLSLLSSPIIGTRSIHIAHFDVSWSTPSMGPMCACVNANDTIKMLWTTANRVKKSKKSWTREKLHGKEKVCVKLTNTVERNEICRFIRCAKIGNMLAVGWPHLTENIYRK